MKKFLAFLVLISVMIFSGAAFSAQVEDALTQCPENSVYMVLRLDNTEGLLKWIFSRENIDTFMPLILASENSNEIMGTVEILSAFAENTPLENAAFVLGMNSGKIPVPFFQMALTVQPELSPIVKRISDGSASAVDIAKLFLGIDSPLSSFAESMIKVEKAGDDILKIDNEIFMKAQDDIIILGLSENDVKASLNSLENSELRLFDKYKRKFSGKDFLFFHFDPETAAELDDDNKSDDIDLDELKKVLDKPLNVEVNFERMPEKFIMSMAFNLKEALNKFYAEKTFRNEKNIEKVKGGHLNPIGKKSPLLMFSGFLDLSLFKDYNPETEKLWNEIVKQLKNRFGLTENDVIEASKGSFSFTVNDNVSVEGIKIPAIYTSMTGKSDKIFNILAKSPHFHKVQEGVLQIDSSVSPVSCIVENKNGSLGIHFADLENISAKPEMKTALNELMDKEAVSGFWIDFDEIRNWIVAPENGVLIMLEPLARFTGNGEIFDDVRDLLGAEFSVPSISFWADSQEITHTQFNIAEINSSNGFLRKVVNLTRKYMNKTKTEEKKEK